MRDAAKAMLGRYLSGEWSPILDAEDRIRLARECRVKRWLRQGLVHFIEKLLDQSPTPATLAEAADLVDAPTLASMLFICYLIARLDGDFNSEQTHICACSRTVFSIRGDPSACNTCQDSWHVVSRRLKIQELVDTVFEAELAVCMYEGDPEYYRGPTKVPDLLLFRNQQL